jgi:hypothetical protein
MLAALLCRFLFWLQLNILSPFIRRRPISMPPGEAFLKCASS